MNNIIPKPLKVKEKSGEKILNIKSSIFVYDGFKDIITFLKDIFPFDCSAAETGSHKNKIYDFEILYMPSLKREEYFLKCSDEGLKIAASTIAGAFYGVITLMQLCENIDNDEGSVKVPYIEINDCPRYKHRGLHLDVSRHFFDKYEIMRLLDLMAFYKLNVFHWHLTDDQGWRIEIRKYPLLTEIGAYRKDSHINGWGSAKMEGKPHSGFYTQDDIKEVVAYAAKRNIMIIPEIDMPAHFAAAMAAYPFLGCRELKRDVFTFFCGKIPESQGIKDWNRPACPGKESTYEFIENIIDEMCELFPAPYFHIGGDEAPKEEWKQCPYCQQKMKENKLKSIDELQGYFNNRIEKYVRSKGKHLIVWNDALSASNLNSSVVGQYWTPKKDHHVIEHLKKGGEIIVSKHEAFYFDMCYCEYPLTNTYGFDPLDSLIPKKYENHILGMEGALWTEWIPTREKLDLHLFPRIPALAEICWSKRKSKNLTSFCRRWDEHKKILKALDVNYAEDEISMPKGKDVRKRETKIWYSENTDRELIRNRQIKR